MKNPNGYGSISYLGKKRRRPYMVRITSDRYYDKKADKVICKRTVLGYYATRKEAMIALAKYNEDPYDLKTRDITFKEVYELWSEHGLDGLSESSHMVYAAAFKNAKVLHDMPISKIKTDDMENILRGLSSKSKSTVSNVAMVFHKVFNYAIQRDLVAKDYSEYITIKTDSDKKEEIHTSLTTKEISLLWENLDTTISCFYNKKRIYHTPASWLLIMIYTGMRPIELINMKTENIYLNERYMIGGAKTKNGKNRIIPIHNDIIKLLTNYYDSKNKHLIIYADKKPPSPAQFRKMIKELCSLLNMNHLPHDGRHTFATFAKRCKIDEFYIQKIMGHTPTGITNRVYTHVEPKELIAEVNKIKFI